MKEIGGYIEVEYYQGEEYHNNCVALNSARNCLRYVIKSQKVKSILLPTYNCSAVEDVCRSENIEVDFYLIDQQLNPILPSKIHEEQFVYVVNYFGQLTDLIKELAKKYGNRLIVDNVQAFFETPIKGVNTIYTCRKYFGVPDGAYLYTRDLLRTELSYDISYAKFAFLAGRYEKNAGEFYSKYKENEELHEKQKILQMSRLTKNILKSIDYQNVKKIRENNYCVLDNNLSVFNEMNLKRISGPYMYPLLIKNSEKLKKFLIENKIFIPTLWPNVLENNQKDETAYYLAKNILPIPCDQRYGESDMEHIITLIKTYINA